jgi:hypothetical protein
MVSLVGQDRENPGKTVLVCSIDGLGLPRLDFLKIDVEGMEADVPAEARTMRARSP